MLEALSSIYDEARFSTSTDDLSGGQQCWKPRGSLRSRFREVIQLGSETLQDESDNHHDELLSTWECNPEFR